MTRRCDDTGSATVELAIWTPLLVAVVLALSALARHASADELVTAAAHDAARAASLEHDPQRAAERARAAAIETITGHIPCSELQVAVDTSDFTPGGTVTATVRCVARLTDLALPHLPGSTVLSSRSVTPLDPLQSQ